MWRLEQHIIEEPAADNNISCLQALSHFTLRNND